jgi:hypothetical protein
VRTLLPKIQQRIPPDEDRRAVSGEIGRALANSVALEPGRLWSISAVDGGPVHITCVAGQIWITQTGDARDHLLAAGKSFLSPRGARGKIVVQAMTRANISIRRAGLA